MTVSERDFTPAAANANNPLMGLVRSFFRSANNFLHDLNHNPAREAKRVDAAVQAALWDDEFNYHKISPILKLHPELSPPIVMGLVNEFEQRHGKAPDWDDVDQIINVRLPELKADPEAWQAMFTANDRSAEIEARVRARYAPQAKVLPIAEFRPGSNR